MDTGLVSEVLADKASWRPGVHWLRAGYRGLDAALAFLIGLGTMVLLFIINLDVLARFVFNQPIRGALEVSRVVLAFVVFLSFGYALTGGTHARITLVVARLPGRLRLASEAWLYVSGILLFGVLVLPSWLFFFRSWNAAEHMPTSVPIPFWIAKFSVPAGIAAAAVVYVALLVKTLLGNGRPQAAQR